MGGIEFFAFLITNDPEFESKVNEKMSYYAGWDEIYIDIFPVIGAFKFIMTQAHESEGIAALSKYLFETYPKENPEFDYWVNESPTSGLDFNSEIPRKYCDELEMILLNEDFLEGLFNIDDSVEWEDFLMEHLDIIDFDPSEEFVISIIEDLIRFIFGITKDDSKLVLIVSNPNIKEMIRIRALENVVNFEQIKLETNAPSLLQEKFELKLRASRIHDLSEFKE